MTLSTDRVAPEGLQQAGRASRRDAGQAGHSPQSTGPVKRRVARLLQILSWTVVIVGAAAALLPIVWMLATSFRPEADLFAAPARLWPLTPTLEGYREVWSELPFARLTINTFVFALGTTLLLLLVDSLAAFALARLDFPFRRAAFWFVIATLMIPFQVTLIPAFELVNSLGWLDTYHGLIVPRMASAFGIFLLRQFFLTIPKDLDEAAAIDGASPFQIYWRIALPLARPALATLFVIHFMNLWNDFLWPLVMTTSSDMRTLPAGLTLFAGQHVTDHAVVMAGATISLAPLAIAFLFAQRYFVQGIATTGIK
jgi:multiple sugar transport system permease protein